MISGAAGYTLGHGQSDEDYPALDQCDYDSHEVLRKTLSTKLFKGSSDNRFTPVHRHIAEFLGARQLAQLVDDGLPARRPLSLITGEDGTVVTEMRGLAAWFAAHCRDARSDLIERDPIGVGLYGDIREFSPDEKRALLKALNREGSRLGSVFRRAAVFGALAAPDMESVFKELLTSSCRSRDHQMLTELVLRVLGQGAALPSLSKILLKIVRDNTWWLRINTPALDAFIHLHNNQDKTSKLKELLADIQSGSVSDPGNELLGTLLAQLYPQELPPSEVWSYLSETGAPEFIGRHCVFWDTGLIKKSSPGDVAVLLDSLAERLPRLRPALDARHLSGLPLKLLAAGLKARGNEIETGRLYDWLTVGSLWDRDPETSWYGDESIRHIRSWLEQYPDIQKAVILEGLDRCPETDEFRFQAFEVYNRLYGAARPHDIGLWCLKQAVAMANTKPQVAEHLLEAAVLAHTNRSGNAGLSLEVLQEHARKNEKLETSLARMLSPRSIPPEYLEEDRKYIEDQRRQKEQWLSHVRSNEITLRGNRAAPALLHQMAGKYFRFPFGRDDGPKAVEKMLQDDQSLIHAALQGLRGAINREDVPELEEILSLREKGRMHYLALPFLVGLAEIERTSPEDSSRWGDDRIRKALAFYYCTPHGDYRPEWYRRLLETQPEVVADVQVRFAVSEFRSDREGIYKLWQLAHDPDHTQVARHASLPLLRAFPIRCKLKHIRALDHLLWAALQHADRALFREVIGRKLSRTSMDIAQRVHWLAAGTIVLPGAYKDHLKDLVQGHERRIPHLAAFFCPEDRVRFSFDELESPVLELLIRLVGSYVGPDQWADESGLVTPTMESSGLVHKLIQNLAASPDRRAGVALDTLHADSALARWQDVLSQAQDAQRVIHRDAGYRHPNIEQVCRTLNGGTPANAGDLAALVMDRLCEIAASIRTGNTDDWRRYWNEDPYGRPCTPKPENSCRKALLSDLRKLLPQGADAQPEGQYANDKRADIRVSYRYFQVPVEVKKNEHRDLWSALKDQLIKLYTSDPDTNGYGIYLVFWFSKNLTPPPPSGTRPDSPQKLQEQLKATLSEDEARKISVCVIDVSRDPKESGR